MGIGTASSRRARSPEAIALAREIAALPQAALGTPPVCTAVVAGAGEGAARRFRHGVAAIESESSAVGSARVRAGGVAGSLTMVEKDPSSRPRETRR
jgi:hypothetical protein